jgi:16S rRNA (adenine1518-N6/adenine1519-N6)-dimethyltransferase
LTEIPDVTSPRVLRELFGQKGLKPHKKWGQNFLIDANIVRKIAAALEDYPGNDIIEIGPGAGALTSVLASRGNKLLALEIDRGLVTMLEDLYEGFPKVKILQADALKVNWQELNGLYFDSDKPVKLVSNLPYVISGPFMFSILKEAFPFSLAVLMLQKEVAMRLVSPPGECNYGALSVLCRYYTTGQKLFDVSSSVFWPKPKVGSAVIKMLPRRRSLEPGEEPLFWKLVQGVFQQRRKTIDNNVSRLFNLERARLSDYLTAADIVPGARPEELEVEQFAKLTRIIYNDHQ